MGSLTDAKCRTIKPPPGESDVKVADGGGLYLRIRLSGSKTWLYRYRVGDRTRWYEIGAYDATDRHGYGLSAARAEAARLSLMRRQGIDPCEQRDDERQAKAEAAAAEKRRIEEEARQAETERKAAEERQRYTLRALLESYVEHLRKAGKDDSASDAASAFACHVYPHTDVANALASGLTTEQAAGLIHRVWAKGKERTAGKLRSYMHRAYALALTTSVDPRVPRTGKEFGLTHNPLAHVVALPVAAGDRHLSQAELGAYLSNLSDGHIDQVLRLDLYAGGQRMEQLLRATIEDYDPATGALLLWDSKGKRTTPREHLLPLGPLGRALIERLIARSQALAAPDRPAQWICTTDGTVPLYPTTPTKRVGKISALLGGEPFKLADLRRSAETLMTAVGIAPEHRAHVQSHDLSGVQHKHYNRYAFFGEKRAALEAWEAALEGWEQKYARKAETLAPKRKSPRPQHVTGRKSRAKAGAAAG